MADKLTKVEISFDNEATWTDVSSYCKGWTYKGQLNNRADTLNLNFVKTIKDTYNLIEWLPIRVYEGWTTSTDRTIFKGLITRLVDEYLYIKVDCADEIYKLLKAKRVSVYDKDTDPQAGVISAIAEDLMDEVLPTIVEDSGTSLLLNQFITSNKTNILERVSTLAKALDWIILYDPEVESAYFVSRGYWSNSRVLTFPTDLTERPKWDEDATRLYNDLTFIGGTASGVRTKLFSGTGSETTFEVDLTPSDSVLVEVYESSVWTEKVQGTPGVSLTYDYYIDKVNKLIIFTSGSIPASGTDNVRVTISAQIPPIIHLMDEVSIETYNIGTDTDGNLVGIKETIVEDDVTSNDDAETRAQNLLSTYSTPFLTTTVTLKASIDKIGYYKLGEKVLVTDSNYGLTEQEFIITIIERSWPGGGAKITLGDEAYRLGQLENDIQSRLDALESRLSGDYEVLADFRNATRSMTLLAKSFEVSTNSVAGDYGIWDHPIYGIWDTSKWAPDSTYDTGGFILGHPIYGVLGSSKLGESVDNSVIIDSGDYE